MNDLTAVTYVGLFLLIAILWFCFWQQQRRFGPRFSTSLATELQDVDLERARDNFAAIESFAEKWVADYKATMGEQCHRYLPSFHPENWNASKAESQYNNCYAYAFRNMELNRQSKPQPGNLANVPEVPPHEYTCNRVFQNTRADHPGIFAWDDKTPCPCGHFKAMMVLDTGGPKTDFHYLRQDSNGLWSQKLGSGPATRLDASNKFITDPRRANLDYGVYNYNTRCSAFCIPAELGDVDW
jgi:hypothetical protein